MGRITIRGTKFGRNFSVTPVDRFFAIYRRFLGCFGKVRYRTWCFCGVNVVNCVAKMDGGMQFFGGGIIGSFDGYFFGRF